MTASSAITPTDTQPHSAGACANSDNSGELIDVQEQRWIHSAADGNMPAFEKLMALHEDLIFQLCLRLLGCREDALEASQDVFIRAHQALPRYHPSAKFSTWLCQIAVNRCRDRWKHSSSRLASLCDALHLRHSDLACPSRIPDTEAETRDDLAILELGLRKLARKHREILVLACIENLPHSECAQILKCSERAIEGRVYRARKLLQDWWHRHA